MRKRLIAELIVVGLLATGVPAAEAGTATRVAAARTHTCAVMADGSVSCWGGNAYGQLGDGTSNSRSTPTPVQGLGGVVAIATGWGHTCAVTTAGGVMCWGYNYYGQLGDGTTTQRKTPVAVTGLPGAAVAVATGHSHTCALTVGGAVLCWGRNDNGQLGDSSTTTRLTPTPVLGLGSGVSAIATGYYHSCAVTSSGGATCWGVNSDGQLGDNSTTARLAPVAVSGLSSGVSALAGGYYHTCALTTGGAVSCWGNNIEGQLGDGTQIRRLVPVAVSGLSSGVTAIAAGYRHSLALAAGGVVMGWGYNHFGQAGGGTYDQRLTPVMSGSTGGAATAISAGGYHSAAVAASGSVTCWGMNADGELGDGSLLSRSTPTPVIGLATGVSAVSVGHYLTCARTSGGAALCWGENYRGGLGDGTLTNRTTPGEVAGLGSGVAAVTAGDYHSCARTTAGAAACWGGNGSGQLGDGTYANRLSPVGVSGLATGVADMAAGADHTCALTAAGGVLCWGANAGGQLGDGTTTLRLAPVGVSGLGSGAVAIAAGGSHACAVTAAGSAYCWGGNTTGQIGNGNTTTQLIPVGVTGLASGVRAIAAGYQHTCALTSAGGVMCWGYNGLGQLGDGTSTDRYTPVQVTGLASGVTAITAGTYSTCALMSGGAVKCWGYIGYSSTTPLQVTGLTAGVTAISAGGFSGCAVTADGGLRCWGDDSWGQLGLGTRAYAAVPHGAYGLGGIITCLGVTPNHGPRGGGTAVTVTGGYFLQGATVTIGGAPATAVTVVNTETITATTAPGTAGVRDVIVRNPDGTEATLAGAFTYEGTGQLPLSDFSGDLKSDVLWHHAGRGEVWLWPMNGGTRTAESFVRTVGEAGWQVRGTGDLTGDGKADVLWRHAPTGMVYLWTMNGSSIQAETYVGTVDPAYDIVGTGDYNGDGKSDLLWRHLSNGELWVWLMNGTTIVSATYVTTVDPGYAVVGSGDLNGDGKADIVWRHETAGDVWVWLMNGATPTSMTYVTTVGELGYQIVGVADHTGDGKADILWHHSTRGEVWLWPMNGAALVSQSYVATVPDAGYRIVGNGDYNGDGKADILWHHATRGEVWVWLMDGAVKLDEQYVGSVPDVQYQIVTAK